jgi:transposase
MTGWAHAWIGEGRHSVRESGILHVVRSGCLWRYLPTDLPPWQTVYWYFHQWEQVGVATKLLAELRVKDRQQAGREEQPSAGIIDSQSVKGAVAVLPAGGHHRRR